MFALRLDAMSNALAHKFMIIAPKDVYRRAKNALLIKFSILKAINAKLVVLKIKALMRLNKYVSHTNAHKIKFMTNS